MGSQLTGDDFEQGRRILLLCDLCAAEPDKLEKTFNEELTRSSHRGFHADEIDAGEVRLDAVAQRVALRRTTELVRNLNGQTFLGRTLAWDADLEKR